jgi:hypothetical protein
VACRFIRSIERRGSRRAAIPDGHAQADGDEGLHRLAEALRSAPLPIGPAEVCAERLAAWWSGRTTDLRLPLADELRQLELFRERVTCLVPRRPWARRA